MRVHIVSNDSTVFLKDQGDVSEIFGGRYTEVRNFCKRASLRYEIKISIITGEYGLLTSPHRISRYEKITDSKEEYVKLERKFCYSKKIFEESKSVDVLILFVPKDMTKIILQQGNNDCKLITVTNYIPKYKESNQTSILSKQKELELEGKMKKLFLKFFRISNQVIANTASS